MSKTLRLNWIAFASSAFLIAAILYVLSGRQGLDTLIGVWRHTDALSFALAILTMLVVQAVSAYRVKIVTDAEGLDSVAYPSLLRIQLISQFVAYGAPISALSDLAKAAMLKLRFNLPLGQSVRIVLYERISAALGAVLIGFLATLAQLALPVPRMVVNIQFLVWGAGLLGAGIIFAMGELHVASGISLLDRAIRTIVVLSGMLRHPLVAGRLILVSILQLLGFSLILIILAQGMHLSILPLYIFLFMPFIFLISSLPIFYQGWGGREAVVIFTIGGVGSVTDVQAVALSVAFGVVVAASSIPGALFWAMRPSMRKSIEMEVKQT